MSETGDEQHVRSVGALASNLQSLEFLIRGFLSTVHDADKNGLLPGMPKDLTTLMVGQSVPENHMTNYDSLSTLVDKYNDYVGNKAPALSVNRAVVNLRDALAHGRVFQEVSQSRFQLLKLGRPAHGLVQVTFSETMNRDWFRRNALFTIEQVKKVHDACQLFAPSMIV